MMKKPTARVSLNQLSQKQPRTKDDDENDSGMTLNRYPA
jgi:hypothetical protein